MPNIINAEHDAAAAMTITLASLADAAARQSTMISNLDNGQMVRVYFSLTTGTTPTVNKTIEFYLLSGDLGTPIRTDGAGASDAAITIETAPVVYAVQIDATSDKAYSGSFLIRNPGPEWGIAVKNNTGAALNSTGGNHEISYVVENVEVQG